MLRASEDNEGKQQMKRVYAAGAAALMTVGLAGAAEAEPGGSPVGIELNEIGRYTAPGAEFDEGGAEIVSYDAATQQLFTVNGSENTVDVLDIADPSDPTLVEQVSLDTYGDGVTSVAARDGLAAVVVHPEDVHAAPGAVVFLDTASFDVLGVVEAGFLPDSVTFSPDGDVALVANEGEPGDDYTVDPVGSLTLIEIDTLDATQIGFTQFNDADLDESIRIFGPGATVAQDLEPEYAAFSADSGTAWVTLQENNAIATVDIAAAEVTELHGLGFKDWATAGSGFDASNRDDAINIRDWPVKGIPMPDAISSYQVRGTSYLVTANEGDSRDYDGYSEEERIKDVELCEGFEYDDMDAATLQQDENLGRLHITTANGFDEEAECFEELYAYGARSFSIYDTDGELVFDSGSDFEEITAEILGEQGFNANNDESGADAFDSRSDDKGPEPEGVAIGKAYGQTYAFVGLERVGGVMTYQVSDPTAPEFVSYTTGRDFAAAEAEDSIDLGPEGVLFISDADSPTGRPLLVLSHEVTGSTTIHQVDPVVPGRR